MPAPTSLSHSAVQAAHDAAAASGDFSALVPEIFHDIMAVKGGCVIPDTAQRAISLEQLEQVVKGHVEGRLLGQVLSITASDQEVGTLLVLLDSVS